MNESRTSRPAARRRRSPRWVGAGILALFLLGLVTVVFATIRVADMTEARSEEARPRDRFEVRYVENPATSYLHMGTGVVFVLLGPLQMIRRVRRRWLWLHRLSGRVFVVAGALAAVSAMVMALDFPAFGGLPTQTATLFFGPLFLACLAIGLYRARRKQIAAHREWMIRAFAIGLGVSTIRFYILLFTTFTSYTFEQVFGVCFWLAFATHAVAAEVWIQSTRPARVSVAK